MYLLICATCKCAYCRILNGFQKGRLSEGEGRGVQEGGYGWRPKQLTCEVPKSAPERSRVGTWKLKLGWGRSTDIVVKQTGQAGCWPTVDIQTSFHSFLLLLVHLKLESKWTQGLEFAPIQSPNCTDWHSKHLRVRISCCPPLGQMCYCSTRQSQRWQC